MVRGNMDDLIQAMSHITRVVQSHFIKPKLHIGRFFNEVWLERKLISRELN